jgi:arylformamidase
MKEESGMTMNTGAEPQRRNYTESGWIDVTLPLEDGLVELPRQVAAGPVREATFKRFFDVDKGDKVTMSRIEMNSHDGTHVDAPLHFFYKGQTIDQMPIETGVGPARILEIQDSESIKVAELEAFGIQPGERLLFKTRNSGWVYRQRFIEGEFVYFTTAAAQYLADKKTRLVGLDYLTIGKISEPSNIKEVHETFLGKGVFVLEGLNLAGVKGGPCELICLPLRLKNGDAAPARVVVRMGAGGEY